MDNIIVGAILVLIIGGAIAYMIKSKKDGVKCIGCPEGCHCSAKDSGTCTYTCPTQKE